MRYALLADIVVAVHVAYVAFVVLGQIAILIGLLFGWGWVRNVWFRLAHLLAIGIVAGEALWNIECPLTVWERQLRTLAGQQAVEGTFVGRLMHNLLYYDCEPWVFTVLHLAFAVVVLATFILAPPRWRARAGRPKEKQRRETPRTRKKEVSLKS
ncbi:MAG: DUF2784 domain-containing protein [Gemmataceae bacterium]